MKQKRLEEKLRRIVLLEEIHMLCEELGLATPEETMDFIETAPVWEIENIINRGKRKRKRQKEAVSHEYDYAYIQ